MKILVFGSNGMAGHVVVKYLKNCGHTVHTVARSNADYFLDIEKTELTKIFINEIKHDYDFIINCVGLLVKDSIERPDLAILINSWFPHYIEYAIKDSKTKLIHLSTDCVFDGSNGNYIESDFHSETNYYGRSKSLGEVNNQKDITFRMSIIGPEIKSDGTGLLQWILKNTESNISGWENAWWNGVTTLQLAKCIEAYIQNPKISGIYHLVNNYQKINKYELLKKINEIYSLNKNVIKTNGPKNINKVLINTRTDFSFEIVDYDQQLIELRDF
jgi:dTDP-4-dehydrorhamnose reductase